VRASSGSIASLTKTNSDISLKAVRDPKCELVTCLEVHAGYDIACDLSQTKIESELGFFHSPTVNWQSSCWHNTNRVGDCRWYHRAGQPLNASRFL
jgi:hypothetical protein